MKIFLCTNKNNINVDTGAPDLGVVTYASPLFKLLF